MRSFRRLLCISLFFQKSAAAGKKRIKGLKDQRIKGVERKTG
jgi:hypothetical protein